MIVISFSIIGYRTISLASVNKTNNLKNVHKNIEPRTSKKILRGKIFDRNKKILATTISTLSLNINPQEILNKHETIHKLKQIFPHLNENLLRKLNSNKKHVNLLREISPREYVGLLKKGIEGLKIQKRRKRIYPNNTLPLIYLVQQILMEMELLV